MTELFNILSFSKIIIFLTLGIIIILTERK